MNCLHLENIILFGIVAVALVHECMLSLCRIYNMHKHRITASEPALYNYYWLSAIASLFMGIRTIIVIFMPGNIILFIIRVISSVMVITVIHLASVILWKIKISPNYMLPGKKGYEI